MEKKEKYEPRLKKNLRENIIPLLKKELAISSVMMLARLQKIVVSMSVNEAKEDIAALEQCKKDLAAICGQFPKVCRTKKSISNFKIRAGMPIGLMVTMRGARMYEFLDRFISIACPRIRDFRGFTVKGFDGNGNLNIGLKEHHIFPEVNLEKSPKTYGLNITFSTTTRDDKMSKAFLERLGIPFRRDEKRRN